MFFEIGWTMVPVPAAGAGAGAGVEGVVGAVWATAEVASAAMRMAAGILSEGAFMGVNRGVRTISTNL